MSLRPLDSGPELSEEEFRLLRDFIHENAGLNFEDSQRVTVRSRLAGRLLALDLASFEDYYHYLRFSPHRAEEFLRLVDHLTNNETYFFREAPQLKVFSEQVLKAIKDRKTRAGERALRVLSVGCSSGEEVLTLAMLASDSGQFFWGWDLRFVGLDIDQGVVERATRGVYHQNSFRSTSPLLLERHFTRDGNGWAVRDSLRRQVEFRLGNLLDPASYEGLVPVDVLFCRNVLIYFSDVTTARAVRVFHSVLAPGGYLFLGHAESLSRVTSAFTPIRFPGAMIYQKPESPTR